jgi:flavin reductase (DIM6/NTAB) family NADH-FMN oxidoreductase RutF
MLKSIGTKSILFPLPVLLIGSYDEAEKADFMTASWGGVVSSDPQCLSVSVRPERYTYNNIRKNRAFSVCFPAVKHAEIADYCGIFSAKNTDKISDLNLKVSKSELANAPILDDFPVNIVCRTKTDFDMGTHTVFIGEIIDMLADPSVIGASGFPEIDKVDPMIYDLATKTYYSVGAPIMKAYTTKRKNK